MRIFLLLLALLAPLAANAQETVKVHSPWPEAQRQAVAAAAPGLRLQWVPVGEAEVLLGMPVRALMAMERAGQLEAYTPAGAHLLRAGFRSASAPTGWVGLTARAPAICFNTIIGNQTYAMPQPTTWETLAGSAFRLGYGIGPQLRVVDPAIAPVGAELLVGWIAAMGETAAARFVRALAPNVAAVTGDPAEACRAVARGEGAVGIGVTADALRLAREGAPLQVIVPTPVAYDMDGLALRKGAGATARKVADAALSVEAMTAYARASLIVGRPGIPGTIDAAPPASSRDLETIDFGAFARPAATLLNEWRSLPVPKP